MQVLPSLPIGAERNMWSGPAAGGRFFLWAPNEIDDVVSGHASGLSARGAASHPAHSTADLTNATSVDGDSMRDTRDLFPDSDSAFGGNVQSFGTALQSQGSTQTSPVRTPVYSICDCCYCSLVLFLYFPCMCACRSQKSGCCACAHALKSIGTCITCMGTLSCSSTRT